MYKKEKKEVDKKLLAEDRAGGFKCINCGQWVNLADSIGTAHRNHCPFCFCSCHVDRDKSGDRRSDCFGKMKPIGLTFKNEGFDKYGKKRQGELMFIHQCTNCGKISINRIAGDDDEKGIMRLFEESQKIDPKIIGEIEKEGIVVLREKDRQALIKQLPSI
ncbi:MAG TPA: RNHCP domain-containing protein [Patescibacteria group bacterium]|nr:RNHCP domain-containing protein [Patescibacteria group bacterium]